MTASAPIEVAWAAAAAEATAPADADTGQAQALADSIAWLIRLRWIALAGVALALTLAGPLEWVDELLAPCLVACAFAAYNLLLYRRDSWRRADLGARRLTGRLMFQLHVDLLALALLLHGTGRILNPFLMLSAFPVAIGAMLLPAAGAVLTGTSAFLLFAGLLAYDRLAGFAHRTLPLGAGTIADLILHPVYLVALLAAVGMTLFGIVYFIQAVVGRHRQAEAGRRLHERIAASRERMARVGTIAAGVAHSVRNPLHGVFNCLDLVRNCRTVAEADEPLDLMQEGLSRIEKVTSRLLALTRETPLQLSMVDPGEVVVDTLHLLDVRAHKLGIEIRRELADVPRVPLDPIRIQETLFNILDNALAAVSDEPGGSIVVRTSRIRTPFDGICLEVVDTGVGVDPEVLPRVFDPFFSTKPVGEGTGLGLAIAKEVVEAHGGVIQFTSRRHTGTTVRVLLPSAPAIEGVVP